MPCRSSTARYGPAAYWVDSSGRRNTLTEGVAMRAGRRRSDRALRAVLPGSPGRPGVAQRENRRRFWAAGLGGRSVERGRGDRGRRVARAGGPLVPGGGRDVTQVACAISEATLRAVSGVR